MIKIKKQRNTGRKIYKHDSGGQGGPRGRDWVNQVTFAIAANWCKNKKYKKLPK